MTPLRGRSFGLGLTLGASLGLAALVALQLGRFGPPAQQAGALGEVQEARLVAERVPDGGDAVPAGGGAEAGEFEVGGEAAPAERIRALEDELAALRRDLARERDRRFERERAFIEYGRVLGGLRLGEGTTGAPLEELLRQSLGLPPRETPTEAEAEDEEQREAAREAAEALARSAERARTFNALARLEGVVGFELLEGGLVHADGWGPVVFRLLDGDGRLAGHLSARRLRLEGSKGGRSLTLVLTGGHEAHGGHKLDFEDGERRLVLRPADLAPFAREFPELFDPAFLAEPVDDGRWPLALVRLRLNELLAQDAGRGYHRLAWLGGVVGDEWRDVGLEVRDRSGRVERVLIADRMRVSLEGDTAVLELADGVSERGGARAPFLDGRLRVVVPRVPVERWRAADLPGIGAPPGS